ncbi:hypothetical protein TIFTF001_024995 [Ficus carica]|uniref:protein-serine/threonine phosphatase n=1 Tax=Ficus carica TaxID=3494 RepID=A0AA88AQL8_FICCA|nr:hypothetical protein TIFTF001_024995 [Ficus carica]
MAFTLVPLQLQFFRSGAHLTDHGKSCGSRFQFFSDGKCARMAGLLNWLLNLAKSVVACCTNLLGWNKDDDDDVGSSVSDPRLWDREELATCSHGQFSFAMVQGNPSQCEDDGQVESGPHGLFVGVYDGHGGSRVSSYCCDNLFPNLARIAQETGVLTEDTLRNAIAATENGFMDVVHSEHEADPNVTAVGSCCLVALLWKGRLHVANLGDCRAVLGRLNEINNRIEAVQLTRDDNVSLQDVRSEVLNAYPDVPDILQQVQGVWRIKGRIQVSKAIGDAFLKIPEYSLLPTVPRLRLREAITRSVLSAEPSMLTRDLQPRDRFLICASDGLWEHITSQRAVQIVNKRPREGIARRLVKAALKVASRKSGVTYDHVKSTTDPNFRRNIHDDITVVVIFFNQGGTYDATVPGLSIRGTKNENLPARFNLQGVA